MISLCFIAEKDMDIEGEKEKRKEKRRVAIVSSPEYDLSILIGQEKIDEIHWFPKRLGPLTIKTKEFYTRDHRKKVTLSADLTEHLQNKDIFVYGVEELDKTFMENNEIQGRIQLVGNEQKRKVAGRYLICNQAYVISWSSAVATFLYHLEENDFTILPDYKAVHVPIGHSRKTPKATIIHLPATVLTHIIINRELVAITPNTKTTEDETIILDVKAVTESMILSVTPLPLPQVIKIIKSVCHYLVCAE